MSRVGWRWSRSCRSLTTVGMMILATHTHSTQVYSPLLHCLLGFPKLLFLNITAKLCIYSCGSSKCYLRMMCLGVTARSGVHPFRCPGTKQGFRSKFLNEAVSCFTRCRNAQYLCGHEVSTLSGTAHLQLNPFTSCSSVGRERASHRQVTRGNLQAKHGGNSSTTSFFHI